MERVQYEGGALISQREAARRLGVSRVTVLRAVKAGRLPAVRVNAREFVLASAIDRVLAGEDPVASRSEPARRSPAETASRT